MQSPNIRTVLHWEPPDLYIFDTDPSLVLLNNSFTMVCLSGLFLYENIFDSIIFLFSHFYVS